MGQSSSSIGYKFGTSFLITTSHSGSTANKRIWDYTQSHLNSSAAVGEATTRAVVASITGIIVLDSAFAAIFTILDI